MNSMESTFKKRCGIPKCFKNGFPIVIKCDNLFYSKVRTASVKNKLLHFNSMGNLF